MTNLEVEVVVKRVLREKGDAYMRLQARCSRLGRNMFSIIAEFGDPHTWVDEPTVPVVRHKRSFVKPDGSIRSPARRLDDFLADYKRWWLGKRVRRCYDSQSEGFVVARIEVSGPPSGVYHTAYLHGEKGEYVTLPFDPNAFKPAKHNLTVLPAPR